jgi:hypothetical protein
MPVPWATTVPRLAAAAEFVPWEAVGDAPNIVVDGPRRAGTVLGLSHWPDGDTPPRLVADTSTEIAARYVDLPAGGDEVRVVTNNHFDEDGLLAAWVVLQREPPGPRRELAIAAAEAGDFHTWRDPWAARCAIALMAMAERTTTPFPEVVRALNHAGGHDPAGDLCRALLLRVAPLLDDPERFRRLWAPRWADVERDLATLDAGDATIADVPEADLALIRAPRPLNRLATHPRTDRMRVVTATPEGRLVLEHRYETWVRYVSRELTPRSDLTPVLDELQSLEEGPGVWRFEGVQHPLARLAPVDANGAPAPSTIEPMRFIETLVRAAATNADSR